MQRIKKDDMVVVIAGKDKGKTGKVLNVYRDGKVVVEDLNIRKKHRKSRREGQKGQIVEIPGAINSSNVMPYCSSCKKPVRVGRKDGEGSKRACRKCGSEI